MSIDKNVVAVIPARGGSKGVPRKNVRPLAGKPLIAYSIETALSSTLINRVVVSTDDSEIATISRQFGAEVPFMRPAELAQDSSPEWLTWQHAIQTLTTAENKSQLDVFVCISPTSPLRTVEDVDACIQVLTESKADIVITVKQADRNPHFNMVVLDPNGYAQLAIQPDQTIYRRQDVPPVYDMTTVAYAAQPEFVLKANSIFEGKVKTVEVPTERALDIDTELDFRFAEFFLGRSKDVARLFISSESTLREVLVCLDRTRRGIALVVDVDHHLLGVITDGDVRHAILAGVDLALSTQSLLKRKVRFVEPVTASVDNSRHELFQLMKKAGISQIPILNAQKQVVGLVGLDNLLFESSSSTIN